MLKVGLDDFLKSFEHLRAFGYMSVMSAVFAGPTCVIFVLRPDLFMDLDIVKLVYLSACIGMPVMAFLGAALVASEAIGALDFKPDFTKVAPGLLALSGMLAVMVEFVSLIFSGGDLDRYSLFLVAITFFSVVLILASGVLDRVVRVWRRRRVVEMAYREEVDISDAEVTRSS